MKKYISLTILLGMFVVAGCIKPIVRPDPCPDCPPPVECPPAVECPDFEELREQQSGYWLHITAPDPELEIPWWMEGDDSGANEGAGVGADQTDSDDPDDNGHGHGHHGGHGHEHGDNR